jgi:hypothetical protein
VNAVPCRPLIKTCVMSRYMFVLLSEASPYHHLLQPQYQYTGVTL